MLQLQKLNILHIEDNDEDAKLIQSHIINIGKSIKINRVKYLKNLPNALNTNTYDLILLDLNLKDEDNKETNGKDTYDAVRENLNNSRKNEDCPIVIVSGTKNNDTKLKLLKNGIKDFVSKNSDTLQHDLRSAISFATLSQQNPPRKNIPLKPVFLF